MNFSLLHTQNYLHEVFLNTLLFGSLSKSAHTLLKNDAKFCDEQRILCRPKIPMFWDKK